LPGERKSIEPMAARLDPSRDEPMRQSPRHMVAKAPWSDEVMRDEVRAHVWPAMEMHGPVVAWIVDDAGFPKKGKHSGGVARQYCGQAGKQDNRRVAVSLPAATWSSSLPAAHRLYLPKEWAEDAARREKAEVPKEIEFQTKPEIALDRIQAAVDSAVARGVVLADAAYGIIQIGARCHKSPRRGVERKFPLAIVFYPTAASCRRFRLALRRRKPQGGCFMTQ